MANKGFRIRLTQVEKSRDLSYNYHWRLIVKELLKRISVNPNICFGKPCIKGTRIWVSLLLDFLADGMSFEEILEDYPQLSIEDIRAAIAYGAEMSRERFVEIKVS